MYGLLCGVGIRCITIAGTDTKEVELRNVIIELVKTSSTKKSAPAFAE